MSDDEDITYIGFKRNDLNKNTAAQMTLEEDGIVFCGFRQAPESTPVPKKVKPQETRPEPTTSKTASANSVSLTTHFRFFDE